MIKLNHTKMETCLLCLEINKEFLENIKVDSILWQEQNVENIIEKHLWTMDTIHPSSWICKICWNVLYDFHKFYRRIEEAHSNLGTLMKTECEIFLKDHHYDKNEHINREDETSEEEQLKSEILIEHPICTEFLVEDQESFIKQEQDDDLCSDDMPLQQRRKRGRPSKDLKIGKIAKLNKEDPLKKTRNCRKPKICRTKPKITNEITLNAILRSSSITETETHEQTSIKDDPDTLNNLKEANLSFNFSHDNENSDTGSEYLDNKNSTETKHKKQKNPDEQTCQEYDKFIAENFQIFCSLCQMPMENFIALRKHFRVEHKKRAFVTCCKRKIFTRPVLVEHIHFHKDPEYFKCNQCGKVLSERSTLANHMKTHVDVDQERKHDCNFCGLSFRENTTLEKHKLKHSADNEKKYSCTECSKFFTTVYNLNYHIQAVHRNKFVKICDMCGKTIRSSNSFKLHMEKHENKNSTPITCDICGLLLADSVGLKRHKNSQHPVGGKKEYACHICSKVLTNVKALRTHIRYVHEVGFDHKCTICNKAFKRRAVLRDHMATHTGTALNTCPWCPKTFVSNGNMYNHRKKDHPREWEELQRQKYATNAAT